MNYIELIQDRIKSLEKIVAMTAVNRSLNAQSRLVEARYILDMLKSHRKDMNERV